MFFFSGTKLRFYLYTKATDIRKSFDGQSPTSGGLHFVTTGIVTNELNGNPLSGDVYIFINKRRDQIKLLVWDRNGFWLFIKKQ